MDNHSEQGQYQHFSDDDQEDHYQDWESEEHFEDTESYISHNFSHDSILHEEVNHHDPLQSLSPTELYMYKEFVSSTQAKLHITHRVQSELMNRLEAVDALEDAIGGLQLPHLQARMAMLTTSLHMFKRYQLVLSRNLLRVKALLKLPVTSQLWQDYYLLEERVEQMRPNVHDIFMWQEDAQEISLDRPDESYVQPSLWRTAQ